MSWYRWLACALCLAAAEGAWLYPFLGLLGFVAGLGHAPVSLAALEGVLLAAVCAQALRDVLPTGWRSGRFLECVLPVVVLWPAVASCTSRLGVSGGLAWPIELVSLEYSGSEVAGLVTVALVLLWCWRRAMARARDGVGAPRIARGFRAGLVVMLLVTGFEAAGRLDLGTRVALVPFFAASLLGMALARAPVHGSRTRAWLALTAVVVGLALAAGLVLGVLLVVVVRGGSSALWGLWLEFATVATESIGAGLAALLGPGGGEAAAAFRPGSLALPEWFVMAVLLAGAALVAALAHRLLDAPAKRRFRVSVELGEEHRESLDPEDTRRLGRWAETMMPDWLRRVGRRRPPARLVRPPGIAGAHALYHRLLALARSRGILINAAHTPFERARELAPALPDVPVDAVTRRFVHARYGGEPVPPETLAELARRFDRAGEG